MGKENNKWKSIIKSGIPRKSDLFLESKMLGIVDLMTSYHEIEKTIELKIELTKAIIKLIDKIPVLEENIEEIASGDFDTIISKWINAESFSSLIDLYFAEEIISNVFSYKLPWIFNGISKKLRNIGLEFDAELIEEISILIEVGLPDLKTVKIYQAGIRSRVYSKEVASLFEDELWNKSIKYYKADIVKNREYYKKLVSGKCREWIDLLSYMSESNSIIIELIPPFQFGNAHEKTVTLFAKEINGLQYLVIIWIFLIFKKSPVVR